MLQIPTKESGIYKHEPGYGEILSLGDLYEKDCDRMPIDEIVEYWNEACQIVEPRTAGQRQDDAARDRAERRERYEAAEDLAWATRIALPKGSSTRLVRQRNVPGLHRPRHLELLEFLVVLHQELGRRAAEGPRPEQNEG